jgi:hypothetical protein
MGVLVFAVEAGDYPDNIRIISEHTWSIPSRPLAPGEREEPQHVKSKIPFPPKKPIGTVKQWLERGEDDTTK